MDIEVDMKVVDKTGKALGIVEQVINDMWSGEPRKYVIMLPNDAGALFFKPDQVRRRIARRLRGLRSDSRFSHGLPPP